jgi:hypothetical protein
VPSGRHRESQSLVSCKLDASGKCTGPENEPKEVTCCLMEAPESPRPGSSCGDCGARSSRSTCQSEQMPRLVQGQVYRDHNGASKQLPRQHGVREVNLRTTSPLRPPCKQPQQDRCNVVTFSASATPFEPRLSVSLKSGRGRRDRSSCHRSLPVRPLPPKECKFSAHGSPFIPHHGRTSGRHGTRHPGIQVSTSAVREQSDQINQKQQASAAGALPRGMLSITCTA